MDSKQKLDIMMNYCTNRNFSCRKCPIEEEPEDETNDEDVITITGEILSGGSIHTDNADG